MHNRTPYSAFTSSYAIEYTGDILSDTSFVLRERVPGYGDEDTTRLDKMYRFHRMTESEKPRSTNWTHTHSDLQ